MAAALVGTLVLVAGIALCGYLWLVAERANSRSAALDDRLGSTSGQLSETQRQLTGAQAEVTQLRTELTELAGEKAQAQDRIADQATAEKLFTAANEATGACADKLIQITQLPATTTQGTFDRLSGELQTLCEKADTANQAVRQYLDRPDA